MNGLLLVDKPAGWTSHDIVGKLRSITRIRRIGHAGTLDPFATGLLVIGIGTGTKSLEKLTGLNKTYVAELTLGATSTTFDPEGVITPLQGLPSEIPLPSIAVEKALDYFRGGYEQRAPLFSAKKRGGVALYKLARQGKATEEMRPVKHVKIEELTIQSYIWPHLRLQIRCGSGTYIRSLGDDLGRVLRTGAYVSALRRTKIGAFTVAQALSWQPPPSLEKIRSALLSLGNGPENLLDRAKISC